MAFIITDQNKTFQKGVDESALLIESLVIESASALAFPSPTHVSPRHFR